MKEEVKKIKIVVPDWYEIDKGNSTFEKIVFKKITPTRWRDNYSIINGFFIDSCSEIIQCSGWNASLDDYNLFATEKQAKAALAMARISQIMTNDERFGGVVSDKEWKDSAIVKFVLHRFDNEISFDTWSRRYHFLAFHTEEQRNLFLKENEDLVRDYFMID